MPLFPKKNHQRTDENEPAAPKLALVLSGGGPRGAMQVGAIRALMERDIIPDMIVGTSIGAVNGVYLARFGYSLETLDYLIEVWDNSARGSIAFGDFVQAALRSLLPGINSNSYLEQSRKFHAEHGITPDLRFRDLPGPKLYVVTADVSHHRIAIFGDDPDDLVLDSMLASAAIPPWLPPIKIGNSLHLDGGAVSDVPIEPAVRFGATELLVLDLFNPQPPTDAIRGIKSLMDRVLSTMEARHLELELELASMKGVTVHRLSLRYDLDIPLWDLSHTHNLIHAGYEAAQEFLAALDRHKAVKAEAARAAVQAQPLTLAELWQALLSQAREAFSSERRK